MLRHRPRPCQGEMDHLSSVLSRRAPRTPGTPACRRVPCGGPRRPAPVAGSAHRPTAAAATRPEVCAQAVRRLLGSACASSVVRPGPAAIATQSTAHATPGARPTTSPTTSRTALTVGRSAHPSRAARTMRPRRRQDASAPTVEGAHGKPRHRSPPRPLTATDPGQVTMEPGAPSGCMTRGSRAGSRRCGAHSTGGGS